MTEAEYDAIPAVRSSWLKVLHTKTPAHLRVAMDRAEADTDAFRLGRAIHTAVLRPEAFADEWIIVPKVDRRTKAGKEEAARIAEAAGDRGTLDEVEGAMVASIVDSVDRSCGDLLRLADLREHPVVADIDGIACKARIDAGSNEGLLLDLKTTLCASPHAFARSAAGYGYLLQMAFYRMVMRASGLAAGPTIIIAVEKSSPYAVAAYALMPDQLDAMEPRVRELLRLYQRCVDDGVWPGYGTEITPLQLRDWAVRGEEATDEV